MKSLKNKSLKNKYNLSKNKNCDNFCKKMLEQNIVDFNKNIDKMKNKLFKTEQDKSFLELMTDAKYKKKIFNIFYKSCKLHYCNPGCKNTILEDGTDLPTSLKNKLKNNKPRLDMLMKTRKNIFKNKTSVLKDNFYIKLKNINKLKQEGAISGCSITND